MPDGKIISGEGERIASYRALELLNDIKYYMITHIPREENENADLLAKLASSRDVQLMGLILVEVLPIPSINQMDVDWILEDECEKSYE